MSKKRVFRHPVKKWSPAEIEDVFDRIRAGESLRDIAASYNVSKHAIYLCVKRHGEGGVKGLRRAHPNHTRSNGTFYRGWTDEEVAEARRLYEEGMPMKTLCERLNRTRGSVGSKLRPYLRNRAHYTKWTPAKLTELRELLEAGYRRQDLAAHFQVTEDSLHAQVCKLGGFKSYEPLNAQNPLHIAEVTKLRMAGYTGQEVADMYGVKLTKIAYISRKSGWRGAHRLQTLRCNQNRAPIYWTETRLYLLNRALTRGTPVAEIQATLFPERTLKSIKHKIWKLTRYALSDRERTYRENARNAYRHRYQLPHSPITHPTCAAEDTTL